MCGKEARVVQIRPVEKAAPDLSGLVGGSVSHVLGLDIVVLDDGGVSYGVVGRYVGDVTVSGGGDTDVSGIVTVVSGAVSGCMGDPDSVSRGDIIVSVDEMSLSEGGDAVVSVVDDTVCGVNSVVAAGVLDLCCVDQVVSGVDEYACGVNSVLAAGVLNLEVLTQWCIVLMSLCMVLTR